MSTSLHVAPPTIVARWSLFRFCLLLLAVSNSSFAADRLALVIGNNAYPTAPLENPTKDAKSVSDALRRLGFSVIDVVDVGKTDMERAIAQFRDALKGKGDVGMLYYAGHAIQINWRNYLVPVDAKLQRPQDVASQTIDMQTILDIFRESGTRLNIVVLDACRDNPFGASGRGYGLAPLDAPKGTFLAYSTAPGNVAEDGPLGLGNSIYAAAFVQELNKPQSRIEDVFKRVRLHVRQKTEGRQIPWESTSIEDEFFFDKGLIVDAGAADLKTRESEFNAEKSTWDVVKTSKDPKDLYAYLQKYPNGLISELAQTKLDELQAMKIKEQAGRDGSPMSDFRDINRHGDRYQFVMRDGLTGLETGRGSYTVEVRGDEIKYVGGGALSSSRVTLGGFILEDSAGTYDPPYPLIPGGVLKAGKRFQSRSIRTAKNGKEMWIDFAVRMVGREQVTVPLGVFDAHKVIIEQSRQDGSRATATLWYEPGWGAALKITFEFRNGTYLERYVREMTARSRLQ